MSGRQYPCVAWTVTEEEKEFKVYLILEDGKLVWWCMRCKMAGCQHVDAVKNTEERGLQLVSTLLGHMPLGKIGNLATLEPPKRFEFKSVPLKVVRGISLEDKK